MSPERWKHFSRWRLSASFFQESYKATGDKLQEKKDDAKESYDRNVTDKIATNPIEESRAHGEIPANTEAVKKVYGEK